MRIALTGGATGIGASVAKKLIDAGHDVTAFDLVEPTTNVTFWIKTDLSDPNSIDQAVSAAEGPFDVLLNNAGLPPREGLAETILKVNFIGFRSFLEKMLDQLAPGAAIVNTASRAGGFWRDNLEQVKAFSTLSFDDDIAGFIKEHDINHIRAYNLSKEAVIAYTIGQTEHMIERGMRMNCVSPAAVSTGILDDFIAAFGERAAKNIARVGRPCMPEEVADLILFLASPQSRWMKGMDVPIDGGMGALAMKDQMGL